MKKNKLYTYKDLSAISGDSKSVLTQRATRLKLKGILSGKIEVLFNKSQAFRILNEHKKIPVKNHPRKIEAVEMYIARMGVLNISNKLRIDKDSITMYAKEYRETGFIIVESSMNLNIIEL